MAPPDTHGAHDAEQQTHAARPRRAGGDERSDVSDSEVSSTEVQGKDYLMRKSRLTKLINWWYVASTYLPYAYYILVGILFLQIGHSAWEYRITLGQVGAALDLHLVRPLWREIGWKTTALVLLFVVWLARSHASVYLLDFAVFEPPESWKCSHERLMNVMRKKDVFTEESLSFLQRILDKSGTGPATAWPPTILKVEDGEPADNNTEGSRYEASVIMFTVVRDALRKAGLKPKDVDFLIVNCSLFSPTPSLCAMIINEFDMRADIRSYNLSGMGCSAGVISIDLAKSLMKSRPNSIALVVSTEIISQAFYHGNNRSFLLQNTLFRCGGAAIVLSNRWTDALRAQFKLLHTVRTQRKGEDSVECVYETHDENGEIGVRLDKNIVKVAGRAMEQNFTRLGPLVLPLSEQIKVVISIVMRYGSKFLKAMLSKCGPSGQRLAERLPRVTPYMPDFKRGIDYFCIHAGGRGVIDGIEKNLSLTPRHTEPSRQTLYNYGNTSSSSIWYELDYIRNRFGCKRGQRALQVAFGSGFKCNSAVWLCLNPPPKNDNPPVSDPVEPRRRAVSGTKMD